MNEKFVGISGALEFQQGTREHSGKVFEIFHRLDPSGRDGKGPGLTIAQRLREKQHRNTWIEPEPGEGSPFFVSLATTNE